MIPDPTTRGWRNLVIWYAAYLWMIKYTTVTAKLHKMIEEETTYRVLPLLFLVTLSSFPTFHSDRQHRRWWERFLGLWLNKCDLEDAEEKYWAPYTADNQESDLIIRGLGLKFSVLGQADKWQKNYGTYNRTSVSKISKSKIFRSKISRSWISRSKMPNARDDLKTTSRRPYVLSVICSPIWSGVSLVIFCHLRTGSRCSAVT